MTRGFAVISQGWLIAKLILVLLIILNAGFILTPMGETRAMITAQTTTVAGLPVNFVELGLRENLFDAANLLFIR